MPTAANVSLIVEVSDSTYAPDRGSKWRKYADASISVYWIVNLSQRQVEVYRQPQGKGAGAAYGWIEVYGHEGDEPVVVGGQEVGRLIVADLLLSAPVEGA